MIIRNLQLTTLFFLTLFAAQAQEQKYTQYKVHTVAFYNVENLFDTIRDPKINDAEYTPTGSASWTHTKYQQKLRNLSRVIAEIGTNDQQTEPPTIIGVSEVENRGVLWNI